MAGAKPADPDKAWNILYQLAEKYYRAHGNLLIPGDYISEGKRLGRWIGTQRGDYKKRKNPFFTQSRIDRLNAIGMAWDVDEHNWQIMYKELQRYAEEYGTVRVPQSYITPEGATLGIWVNRVRMDYKKGTLAQEKQAMLTKLGMIWEPETLRRGEWDIRFDLLKAYIDCNNRFPSSDYVTEGGVRLGNWLNCQKKNYRNGDLLPERRRKLDKLDIVWNIAENSWEIRYGQARDYYLKYGHLCPFTQRGEEMPDGLANWLIRLRRKYKKGEIEPDKIRRLAEIGMLWDIRESVWEAKYQQARAYYILHGHLRVKKDSGPLEERSLGQWISTQRKNYMSMQNPFFTTERIKRLEEIGMVWDAAVDPESLWHDWYRKAKEYYMANGHMRPDSGRLRTWIHAQRYAKKGKCGQLSKEQIELLEQIGMSWTPIEEDWQQMYQYAKEYYQIHKMLNIPSTYVTEDGVNLGGWISAQRQGYKNYMSGKTGGGRNVSTPERIEMLNKLEMIWSGARITASTSFQEKALIFYLKKHFKGVEKMDRWQALGAELDIYIPSIKTAVEYDGCIWHNDRLELDEAKGRLCKNNEIILIRIREPGLPDISQCDFVIKLADLSEAAFERGIAELFEYLKLLQPNHDISRDKAKILATYKDYTSRKWDRMYKLLYEYYREYGNLSVPADFKSSWGVSISNWLNTQREAYRNDELTALQIKKLESIGMVWNPFEKSWQIMYDIAAKYYKKHKNLMIPVSYVSDNNINLGKWLYQQRANYRAGRLSLRRIHLLERIGIAWNPVRIKQEQYMEEAGKYFRKNGHLDIPAKFISENNLRMGEWLSEQRSLYKAGKLDESKQKELEKMDVQWKVFRNRWDDMYVLAKAYFQQHNNLWISPDYITPDGVRLGGWISMQRKKLKGAGKSKKLTSAQKRSLDEIDMVWDPYAVKWLNKYKLAEAFYKEHNHLTVPVDYITECGVKLGMWLSSQRQAMRGNPNFLMTSERKRLLDNIEMDWRLKRQKPDARRRPDRSIESDGARAAGFVNAKFY